jgi:hypothetical protein
MPGDRWPINLVEPQEVTVAHLNVDWVDDVGQKHHDQIHELRLHGRAPLK